MKTIKIFGYTIKITRTHGRKPKLLKTRFKEVGKQFGIKQRKPQLTSKEMEFVDHQDVKLDSGMMG
jgi:hypothetical protein